MQADRTISLKNDSLVKSFPLSVQPAQPGKIFVGTTVTNSYVSIDDYWGVFIELLEKPMTVEQLASKLSQLDPVHFAPKRGTSLVKMMLLFLIRNKMIHQIDHQNIFTAQKHHRPSFHLSYRLVKWVSALMVVLAVLSLFLLPFFFPLAKDFFWNSRLSLCLLSAFLFTWLTAFLHEGAHLVIGSQNGIKGRLKISHRLSFLVLESDFADICAIDKKARIAIYLSGLIIDLASISIVCLTLILVKVTGTVFPGSLVLLLKQFLLLQWLSVLWQFFFYMKTDLYFVIKELVGIDNLYEETRMKIKNVVFHPSRKSRLSPRENKYVSAYGVFLVIGTMIGILRYGFYRLPILIMLLVTAALELQLGLHTTNGDYIFDGAIVLITEGIFNGLLLYTLWKERTAWPRSQAQSSQ